MNELTPPAHNSSTLPGFLASKAAIRAQLAAVGVVVLVAAIYQFGYPLLISLAVLAAFVAIAMMVVLTAVDVINPARAHPAKRARKVDNAAAQAA